MSRISSLETNSQSNQGAFEVTIAFRDGDTGRPPATREITLLTGEVDQVVGGVWGRWFRQ